jgi:hypothetical protein
MARPKGQVNRGKRRHQWYGRPADDLLADNPCDFNRIGVVTGTRRPIESRTKEQAANGPSLGLEDAEVGPTEWAAG